MKKQNAIFIHGNLDDWGLRANAFRVFGHVARRGECFSSISNIAKKCSVCEDTVRRVLKEMVEEGLLSREIRPGTSTIYRVNHQKILGTPPRKEGRGSYEKKGGDPYENKGGDPSEIKGGNSSGNKGGNPSEKKGDEVNPPKSIPLKNNFSGTGGLTPSVEIIQLGKLIEKEKEETKVYRDEHCAVAAAEEVWPKGTKKKYRAKKNEIKELERRREQLLQH